MTTPHLADAVASIICTQGHWPLLFFAHLSGPMHFRLRFMYHVTGSETCDVIHARQHNEKLKHICQFPCNKNTTNINTDVPIAWSELESEALLN